MAELVRQDDRDAYAAANIDFHKQIYVGARNTILAEFAGGLRRRLAPFRRAQFRTEGRISRSHAEHATVLKAILACDAAAAHAAMFQHMSLVEDAFGRLEGARARLTRRGPPVGALAERAGGVTNLVSDPAYSGSANFGLRSPMLRASRCAASRAPRRECPWSCRASIR